MINVQAAVDFLNNVLWTEEKQAYREAIGVNHWWFIDNYVAWMVMRKYSPVRAQVVFENFPSLEDYPRGFDRWCILDGNTADFKPSYDVLPDFCRYADLVALQYLFSIRVGDWKTADLLYAFLTGMYDGRFLTDLATRIGYLEYPAEFWSLVPKPEGHTMYKLALFSMCSVIHGRFDVASQCLKVISEFQVKEGEEKGGIKTEWWNPDWGPKPPHLLTLANVETTSLSILAQDFYNDAVIHRRNLAIVEGIASALATYGIQKLVVR